MKSTTILFILNTDRAGLIPSCSVDFKVSITPATVRILGLDAGGEIYVLIPGDAFARIKPMP